MTDPRDADTPGRRRFLTVEGRRSAHPEEPAWMWRIAPPDVRAAWEADAAAAVGSGNVAVSADDLRAVLDRLDDGDWQVEAAIARLSRADDAP